MNNQEMWDQLKSRHKSFKDPDNIIKLTSRGLKALIDQAYEEGYDNGRKWEQSKLKAGKSDKESFDVMSMFNDFFGGK